MLESVARHFHGWDRRLRGFLTLGHLGITPRLAIAFASVAILAAFANLMVVQPETIVHWVSPDTRATAESTTRTLELESRNRQMAASELMLAISRYDEAALRHAEIGSPDSEQTLGVARAALDRVARDYGGSKSLHDALRAHATTSTQLIQVARDSRAILARYTATLTRMNARLRKSIDGAWKIMGRVVARQSLLKMTAELDEIQAGLALREPSGSMKRALPRLASAEHVFAETLQRSASALRRSQGETWFTDTQKDIAALTAARTSLAGAETRRTLHGEAFARERGKLNDTISREAVLTPDSATTVAMTSTVQSTSPARVVPPAVPANAPTPQTPDSFVAWLSLVVLAVLAYISVSTILSVVRPIRKLLAATAEVGDNGVASPVTVDGLRELETLGEAFNEMGARLTAFQASHRESQRRLEVKVEERTRELQNLAERDPLTGLANRRQLFAALGSTIERARAANRQVGVFFLDIDNFKTLNDSMGHAYGDQVLIAIARRLEASSREFGFAARLGGDEFMIVHEDATSVDSIIASGVAIVQAFDEPLDVENRELIVSVSVGASIYPDHEDSVEALLRAADAALFSAKAQGRSQLTIFTPDLLERASAKFAIEQKLRRAIENEEFELFYQPEIDAETLEVSLVEALIRWRMPDGSYQCPGTFLAVAEESGLIVDINDWVLRTAIKTAAHWHHGDWPKARVAINVAPRQFLDYRFVQKLKALLDEWKLPARCLELELTESVLQTGAATIKTLEQLRSMGVAVALDDFGTGYSSIASLEQLPLTRIKLDRSLISRIDMSARSASIARATIGLCNELGLLVTAEGVERLEQFAELSGYREMTLQGFLLSEAVPRDRLLPLLKKLPEVCSDLVLRSRLLTRTQPASATEPISGPWVSSAKH
jgi:diguanylate cyclase (GGDEF)-like protein